MENNVIQLRDQAAVVRRRWRVVAISTVVGLLAALALSFTAHKIYRSSAILEIAPDSGSGVSTNGLVMQPQEVSTQIQVLLSEPVAQRVIDDLKLTTSPSDLLKTVTVTPQSDTRVVTVTAQQPTARAAESVVNGFVNQYLSFRREQANLAYQQNQQALKDEAKRIRDQLDKVQTELTTATGDRQVQLQNEQQTLLVQLTQVMSDQSTAAATAPSATTGAGQVLVPGNTPNGPANPKPLRTGLLGAFIGFVLGIGLAFVRDHFDDAVRDDTRVKQAVGQRPVLGRIPRFSTRGARPLVTVTDPNSPGSEAYRGLITNVRFLMASDRSTAAAATASRVPSKPRTARAGEPRNQAPRGRVLLVASAIQGEGKTSVSCNLAVSAARFGLRVILVDADLRNPQVAPTMGLGSPPGLTDLLVSDTPTDDLLVEVIGGNAVMDRVVARKDSLDDYLIELEGIKVLAGGSLAPNPAELLASSRTSQLLAALARRADLVIVDSAPILRVADSLELVAPSDLVVMVTRHGYSRTHSVGDAVERIRQVGGSVAGAVYTDVPVGDTYETSYGYGNVASRAPETADEGLTAAAT